MTICLNNDFKIIGLNSATSKYFCRYCFCKKEEINMVKGWCTKLSSGLVINFRDSDRLL